MPLFDSPERIRASVRTRKLHHDATKTTLSFGRSRTSPRGMSYDTAKAYVGGALNLEPLVRPKSYCAHPHPASTQGGLVFRATSRCLGTLCYAFEPRHRIDRVRTVLRQAETLATDQSLTPVVPFESDLADWAGRIFCKQFQASAFQLRQ